MRHQTTLATFPYIVVRIACRKCERRGQYRLANLVERHGASVALSDLLDLLARDCGLRKRNGGPGIERCGAFFADLSSGKAPDVPIAWKGTAARERDGR